MATRKIVVLGAGMVGSVIAADLAADSNLAVRVADRDPAALARASARAGGRIETVQADCADADRVRALAAEADLAVGALASHLGFAALRAVVEAGTPYCDISFMAEDAWTLDEAARERGVVAVVDCGVAPGMSNLLAAHGAAMLRNPERIDIMVGGVPKVRTLPFQYKAAFAPADVLEEYVRPARLVEAGRMVVREALSEIEPVDFPGIGTLEAFNTDGLRSLAVHLEVPFMRERTLRWPGHAALMKAIRDAGLLSLEPVDVGGVRVVPRDLFAQLVFPQWTYADGEADLTVMRVEVHGDGRVVGWDLVDEATADASSMARTTAFPCAIVAREILAGRIATPGVLPPERLVGVDGLVSRVMDGLGARGVRYRAW